MKSIDNYLISENTLIRDAIKEMDLGGIGFIALTNSNHKVVGVLTDGDFRRAVLSGISLNNQVSKIMCKNFFFLEDGYEKEKVIHILKTSKFQHIPVLANGELQEIITLDTLFQIKSYSLYGTEKINLPVVIMAGGKGTRLDPFTRVLPKPLIPLGDKPIIEVIMDKFAEFGMSSFFISVNHKAKMIKAYFEDCNADYSISYIDEDKPLGTAGALKFLSGKIDTPFFVSNCDVLIKDNYAEIYEFHKKGKFDITIVASMQHHTIPYGVCDIGENGNLKQITEKPQYDFLVNTGMYVLEPSVLKFIPENTFFHITDLIGVLQQNSLKVGVYPVSEQSWIDIGQMEEYKKALDSFK